MKTTRTIVARPWLATGVVAAVIAAALFVIPVSWQRTTGYQVQVSLGTTHLAQTQMAQVARELKKAVGASRVMLKMESPDAPAVLVAQVPLRGHAGVEIAAQTFAHTLAARGFGATAVVTPVIEHASGNVYALATDRVLNIHVDTVGKSDEQIAAAIKSQLEAAGLQAPEVSVSRDGDKTKLTLNIQKTITDGGHAGDTSPSDVKVTLDGKTVGDPKFEGHRVMVKLTDADKAGKTDDQIAALVTKQLHDQGQEATVVVRGGKIVSITMKK